MIFDSEERLIVLFDEFGTPTFNTLDSEGIFLGVSASYKVEDEDKIFDNMDELMGLSKSKPLKNDKISIERALDIAQQVGKHDFAIVSRYISLKNNALKEITKTYSEFGHLSRIIFRGIEKERKPAHILHTQISESCLFDIISRYILNHEVASYTIEIYMDNWSYPRADEHIVLQYAPKNVEKKLLELISDNGRNSRINMKTKEFLKDPSSKRKRFIDALTSIISRAFLDEDDPKSDNRPLKELQIQLGSKIGINDDTAELLEFMNNFVYDAIQETKEKEKERIIKIPNA